MLKNNKKIVAVFVAVFCVIICMSSFTSCKPDDIGTNDPATPIYTQARLQFMQKSDLIGIGDSVKIVSSAHARLGNGNYVTSSSGFTYESDNPNIATVDADGTVRGKGEGLAKITVKHTEYGATDTVNVTVIAPVTVNVSERQGFKVLGRARNGDDGLSFVNSASGFGVIFKGTELKAKINSVSNIPSKNNSLRVVTDGKDEVIDLPDGNVEVTLVSGLQNGLHQVNVYKMLDEDASSVQLQDLFGNGVTFYSTPAQNNLKISVYGDGSVSGSGLNATGDATSSFAFKAAQKLGADIEMLSTADVSLAEMKNVWKNVSVKDKTTSDTLSNNADVIVIDLGGSDARQIKGAMYTGGVGTFMSDYKAMINEMLAVNPDAKIICCYGMTQYSGAMIGAIERVVKTLNDEGLSNVYALRLARADEKQLDNSLDPSEYCHGQNSDLLYETIKGIVDNDSIPSVKYDVDKQDIHVIMMGGQSNMEGNSHWRYLENDRYFQEYKTGYSGIKMSFANHESKAENAPDFQAVRLGFGGAYNNSDTYDTGNGIIDDTFGPDIGIAKTLHDNGYDNKVVLIKFAIGGTYFYPRYNGDNRIWAAPNGKLYKAFLTYVKGCLAQLAQTYNVYLDAMFWMQGESDTQYDDSVKAYGLSLSNFVDSLRMEFAEYNSDFMFYDAFINWKWEGDRPNLLNATKEELADRNIYYKNIQSKGLKYDKQPVGKIDYAHYDALDEIQLGKLFAQAYMQDFPIV